MDDDPEFKYLYFFDLIMSFGFEIGVLVLTLTLAPFIMKQQNKINYLSNPDNQESIKKFFNILAHQAFKKNGGA